MEISLVLSILALVGSGLTYWIHDKKLKTQEARINEYELLKIENEKREALKAKVRASSYKSKPAQQTIKILNSGVAIARNIRVEFTPAEFHSYVIMSQFPFPYMNPQDFTEITMILTNNTPDTVEVNLKWDDDFKIDNEHRQILTL